MSLAVLSPIRHVVHQIVKMCIAATFLRTGSTSSYSVHKMFSRFRLSELLTVLIVRIVFLLETLQTALTGADIYYWFISGYGDMKHLTSPFASPFDVPIIESVVSLSVEVFLAYRILVLSSASTRRSGWFCLLICLMRGFPG